MGRCVFSEEGFFICVLWDREWETGAGGGGVGVHKHNRHLFYTTKHARPRPPSLKKGKKPPPKTTPWFCFFFGFLYPPTLPHTTGSKPWNSAPTQHPSRTSSPPPVGQGVGGGFFHESARDPPSPPRTPPHPASHPLQSGDLTKDIANTKSQTWKQTPAPP